MNDSIKARVARFMTRHSFFKSYDYEDFTRTVLYLVKKYGVGGDIDYELGDDIQKSDESYKAKTSGYLGGYDIAQLLGDCASEITAEQQHNRDLIKGVVNA